MSLAIKTSVLFDNEAISKPIVTLIKSGHVLRLLFNSYYAQNIFFQMQLCLKSFCAPCYYSMHALVRFCALACCISQ